MTQTIQILILTTAVLFAIGLWLGTCANRMGDGGIGLGMVALVCIAVPVVGWAVWLVLWVIQHVRLT